jgi:hypothetical protein
MTKRHSRYRLGILGTVLLAGAFATACDDGPTAPVRVGAPTPLPVPNVAGNWRGSYRSCGPDVLGCGPTLPAAAALSQEGSQVTGTVTISGGGVGEGSLEASVLGNQLRGTLTIGGQRKNLTGSTSADHLTLLFPSSAISRATIDLTR